jgi:hypothetical protein
MVKLAKMGHGQQCSTFVFICVVRLLLVLFYVLFVCKCVLPPCDNPTAVNIYVISSLDEACAQQGPSSYGGWEKKGGDGSTQLTEKYGSLKTYASLSHEQNIKL